MPTVRAVTTVPPPNRSRVARELLAVVFVVAGIVGLGLAAWFTDPLLLAAYVSVLLIAGGLRLATYEA